MQLTKRRCSVPNCAAGELTELSCCLEASHQLADRITAVLCELGSFAKLWHHRHLTWNKLCAVGTLLFFGPMPVAEQNFS